MQTEKSATYEVLHVNALLLCLLRGPHLGELHEEALRTVIEDWHEGLQAVHMEEASCCLAMLLPQFSIHIEDSIAEKLTARHRMSAHWRATIHSRWRVCIQVLFMRAITFEVDLLELRRDHVLHVLGICGEEVLAAEHSHLVALVAHSPQDVR